MLDEFAPWDILFFFFGTIACIYFFTVPPGDVSSPFFCAAPAVLAPCVLASFGEGVLDRAA
jgi:hypothetical protein